MSQEDLIYKDAIQEIAHTLVYILRHEICGFDKVYVWSCMERIKTLKKRNPESKEIQKMAEIAFEIAVGTQTFNRFLYGRPIIMLPNDCPYILETFCLEYYDNGPPYHFPFDAKIFSDMCDIKRSCSTEGCNEIFEVLFGNNFDDYSRMYCSKCYKIVQVKKLLKNEQSNH